MAASFFFYDLETTGINPRTSRIMQFAGRRTTLDLEPIGDPVNVLIAVTPDIVPEPDAILITGITPQKTLQEGMTEAEFLRIFMADIATPDTIFVGFNTVRFDDEFIRFMLYRNFYDPYEWQWKDGRSRWDLLDAVRMTRALRPEGIVWPFDSAGKPSNRLELLTSVNKIDHFAAHDALSDVEASIAVARLLRSKQPKLFQFLLSMRDKKKVASLIGDGDAFVYTSGAYASEYEKTTVVCALAPHPKKQGVLVYDLRHDPSVYANMSPKELAERWRWKKDATDPRLPVKTLQYNRCPAVAPMSVLDAESRERLHIDLAQIRKHSVELLKINDFSHRLLQALELLADQQQAEFIANEQNVDAQLYDGFFDDHDRAAEQDFLREPPESLGRYVDVFHDTRLQTLVPLYKARNYPHMLSDDERTAWDAHCTQALLGGGRQSRIAKYFARLAELDQSDRVTSEQRYLLEELQLYGQLIIPVDAADHFAET